MVSDKAAWPTPSGATNAELAVGRRQLALFLGLQRLRRRHLGVERRYFLLGQRRADGIEQTMLGFVVGHRLFGRMELLLQVGDMPFDQLVGLARGGRLGFLLLGEIGFGDRIGDAVPPCRDPATRR